MAALPPRAELVSPADVPFPAAPAGPSWEPLLPWLAPAVDRAVVAWGAGAEPAGAAPLPALLQVAALLRWHTVDLAAPHTPLPAGCTDVLLWNPSGLTAVPEGLLRYNKAVRRVACDPSMAGVREVGSLFLRGCTGLESLDLAPLANVETVGGWFLAGCTGMTSVDLSLANVREVGF